MDSKQDYIPSSALIFQTPRLIIWRVLCSFMSGSPILPNGLDPAANDQPRPGFGSMNQDAYGPAQRQHQAPPDSSTQSGRPFLSEEATQAPFSLFRLDMPAGQLFYQPQPYMMPQSYPASTAPFPVQGTPPLSTESAELKNQRKTKGHVASACVPCKKAHLRFVSSSMHI